MIQLQFEAVAPTHCQHCGLLLMKNRIAPELAAARRRN